MEEDELLGEGNNPEQELVGWEQRNAWQADEKLTKGKCAITKKDKTVIGLTKRKKLAIWASEADGELLDLASRPESIKIMSIQNNPNLNNDKDHRDVDSSDEGDGGEAVI